MRRRSCSPARANVESPGRTLPHQLLSALRRRAEGLLRGTETLRARPRPDAFPARPAPGPSLRQRAQLEHLPRPRDARVRDPEVRRRPRAPNTYVPLDARADRAQVRRPDGLLPEPACAQLVHAGNLSSHRAICAASNATRRKALPKRSHRKAQAQPSILDAGTNMQLMAAPPIPELQSCLQPDLDHIARQPEGRIRAHRRSEPAHHGRRRLPWLLPRARGSALQPDRGSRAADPGDSLGQFHSRHAAVADSAGGHARPGVHALRPHRTAAGSRCPTSTGSSMPPASRRRRTTASTR